MIESSLVIVGRSPSALSVAVEAARAGVSDVTVLVDGRRVVPADAATRYHLRIQQLSSEPAYEPGPAGVVVNDGGESWLAGVVVVEPPLHTEMELPVPTEPTIRDRVMFGVPNEVRGRDVLIIGSGDHAVSAAWQVAEDGGRPVLCLLSPASSLVGSQMCDELERLQLATVLFRSSPERIIEIQGLPMVIFDDRRTPDLLFDLVVFVPDPVHTEPSEGSVYVLVDGGQLSPVNAWEELAITEFPDLDVTVRSRADGERIRELRAENYNATITDFNTAHNELWRVRVRPDFAGFAHRAGQYCTLGLGYWEPRADDAVDPITDSERMIRRSYSISSPIFDERGYLVDIHASDEIELYIVWVRPQGDNVPALTPRLALKQIGDRIYLGPKIAGRYTLDPVDDPELPVIFLATGTGEAPHNAMITELLRKGHHGPILSAVSVRYDSDLAYLGEHRRLEERFPNYTYLPVATREPDRPKRYLQDLLVDGTIEEALGQSLDPERGHVFVCGNPKMIGLPRWSESGEPEFPETTGVAEILTRRGFAVDRRGRRGNVHYEEYW